MENKKTKVSKKQIEKRIENALIHIDKTRDTLSIFFADKGVRIIVNEDYAIIGTNYHRHVFEKLTAEGYSRPYVYSHNILELANKNDCLDGDSYSYAKLLETLNNKEDKLEYNLAVYYEWYLTNIFQPLFSIGDDALSSFLVYEGYLHNLALMATILNEEKDGLTNKAFIDSIVDRMKAFSKNMNEQKLFESKPKEEIEKEVIKAMREDENERIIEEIAKGELE